MGVAHGLEAWSRWRGQGPADVWAWSPVMMVWQAGGVVSLEEAGYCGNVVVVVPPMGVVCGPGAWSHWNGLWQD